MPLAPYSEIVLQILRRWWLCWLIALSALPLLAQDFDGDDLGFGETASPATLSLTFSRQGTLNARLNLPQDAKTSEELMAKREP